jgi:filamentous hemagglutinin family protein
MRATSIPSPIRQGRRRLLGSCAIAAGLAALAFGGPALAQVAGTGTIVSGSGTISPPDPLGPLAPPNSTQVQVGGAETIINWTPTDNAPTGGAIDFLPAGNTLEFYGPGQYTVLNRFTDASGGSIGRQVALNGTVNSYIGSRFATGGNARGGSIWFYNAGGVLIGSTGVVNVGSLVLTANAIDTSGGLFGPGGEIRFRGAAGT